VRVLTITTLYPNEIQIRNGVFVRERLRQFIARHPIESTVIAPVPWFPIRSSLFGRYADFARVPRHEMDGEIQVHHPRFAVIPKLGSAVSPLTYCRAVSRLLRTRDADEFDVIDAHYAFPDGAAAVLLGRRLNKPVVLTVRGSDINLIPREMAAGAWIRWTLPRCSAVVAVSEALGRRVASLTDGRVTATVLRNGVDRNTFKMVPDRGALRQDLGLTGRLVLSVGNLIELKGHHLVIDAIREVEGATLVIIGRGPMSASLREQVSRLGLEGRVRFEAEMPRTELIRYYNAADVLVLASSNEGMPNVLLESLSCGTPVVATAVGGVPEILKDARAGRMLDERSSQAIANALRQILDSGTPNRDEVRAQVEPFDWTRTADGMAAVFESVCSRVDPVTEQEVRT